MITKIWLWTIFGISCFNLVFAAISGLLQNMFSIWFIVIYGTMLYVHLLAYKQLRFMLN